MKVFVCFPHPPATHVVPPSPLYASKPKRNRIFSAKLEIEDNDPLFQAAMHRASLRHRETLRPDPLFMDPYIGCLSSLGIQMDSNQSFHKHCLAIKFIDDKLLDTIGTTDELRQVVLLTDGMDTRPYRLNWPASTIIFDVSPERIFRRSIQKLEGVGAKISRNCSYLHVPSETFDIQQHLQSKGFNGARPSLWAFQAYPIMTLADFKAVLDFVGNLAMKGCLLLGEFPVWLTETETRIESTSTRWMDRLFMKHGLRVEIMDCDEVAKKLGKETAVDGDNNMLFVAEQLRFSDDQVKPLSFSWTHLSTMHTAMCQTSTNKGTQSRYFLSFFLGFFSITVSDKYYIQMTVWRREFQRIEEEGDEDGFEEL